MNKKLIMMLLILLIIIIVLVMLFVIKEKNDSSKLESIIAFGHKLELKKGNVFIFNFEDLDYKDALEGSDTEICIEPIELICKNKKECDFIQVGASTYDEDDHSLELYILDSKKYPSEHLNFEENDEVGSYDRYDYYMKINNIDETKVKDAHYCLDNE